MLSPSFGSLSWADCLVTLNLLVVLLIILVSVYNLYLHPLARIPGPFWGRMSGIPSFYHALRGDRHIWLWQQFQIHGNEIRPEPNLVLFCDPGAYADIYGARRNVRRSDFYTGLNRKRDVKMTLSTTDVSEHARKRRILNIAFSDNMVHAASDFIIRHVDRWIDIFLEEQDSTTEWSAVVDLSSRIDALVFDIMGDLVFGKSFDIKEPGDNPLKEVPHCIMKHMKIFYAMARSPFTSILLWLKPRGFDKLLEKLAPPAVKRFHQFIAESLASRISLQNKQAKLPEKERRRDIFYFLRDAHNPDTGLPAYSDIELRAESGMLIIAGSDTTATSLSGVFFYLTGDTQRYQKVVNEIVGTFQSADDIVYGPKLLSCKYLRACLDEGMRMAPSGPCEMPREVLRGGIQIMGRFYPAGTIVGTSPWADSRNQHVYGDPDVFRPERWIVDKLSGVTEEEVRQIRANFNPFSRGNANCVGQNVAQMELLITLARTIYRLDMRRAPGSTLGGGSAKLGWGARDEKQYHLRDAFVALRKGPEVQFRRRALDREGL